MTRRDRAAAAASDAPLGDMQWIRVRPLLYGSGEGAWLYCQIRNAAGQLDGIKARLGYRSMDWEYVPDCDPARLKHLYDRDGIAFFMESML